MEQRASAQCCRVRSKVQLVRWKTASESQAGGRAGPCPRASLRQRVGVYRTALQLDLLRQRRRKHRLAQGSSSRALQQQQSAARAAASDVTVRRKQLSPPAAAGRRSPWAPSPCGPAPPSRRSPARRLCTCLRATPAATVETGIKTGTTGRPSGAPGRSPVPLTYTHRAAHR